MLVTYIVKNNMLICGINDIYVGKLEVILKTYIYVYLMISFFLVE